MLNSPKIKKFIYKHFKNKENTNVTAWDIISNFVIYIVCLSILIGIIIYIIFSMIMSIYLFKYGSIPINYSTYCIDDLMYLALIGWSTVLVFCLMCGHYLLKNYLSKIIIVSCPNEENN